MTVLDLYAQGGFHIDEEIQDVPDNVALELAFLYLLVFTQNQARRDVLARMHCQPVNPYEAFLVLHPTPSNGHPPM